MALAPPRIVLRPVDPPGPGLLAYRGPGVSRPEGDGGWVLVKRPRNKAMTEWEGYDPHHMTVSLLFSRYRSNPPEGSVEGELEALRRMMRVPVGRRNEPPVIRIEGRGVPLRQLRWVLESVEWGDAVLRADGITTRQFVTVTLREYVPGEILLTGGARPSPAKAAQARAAGTTTSAKTYVVKSGDTLQTIAARQLGDARRWKEIGTLNAIRDDRAITTGQTIRLP